MILPPGLVSCRGNQRQQHWMQQAAKKLALWSKTLSGKDQGKMSLHTPKEPGAYQLVMFDGAKNGTLVFQQTLTLHQADMDQLNRAAELRGWRLA